MPYTSFLFSSLAVNQPAVVAVVILVAALLAAAVIMILNREGMQVLIAELRESKRRRRLTPGEVAAKEAIATYALVCFAIVMSNIVRFGYLKPGAKKSARRAEQEALTAIQPGRDTAALYFRRLKDEDIAHLATWLSTSGRAKPEDYAAFLREERAAAQANRLNPQDHVLRRLRVGQS